MGYRYIKSMQWVWLIMCFVQGYIQKSSWGWDGLLFQLYFNSLGWWDALASLIQNTPLTLSLYCKLLASLGKVIKVLLDKNKVFYLPWLTSWSLPLYFSSVSCCGRVAESVPSIDIRIKKKQKSLMIIWFIIIIMGGEYTYIFPYGVSGLWLCGDNRGVPN